MLTERRGYIGFKFLVSLCVSLMGVRSLPVLGWWSIILLPFAPIAAGLALSFVKPGNLRISADGLAYEGWARRRTWRWRDIAGFEIRWAPNANSCVVIYEWPEAPLGAAPRNVDLRGGPGFWLPTDWPLYAPELRALLQRAKQRWSHN